MGIPIFTRLPPPSPASLTLPAIFSPKNDPVKPQRKQVPPTFTAYTMRITPKYRGDRKKVVEMLERQHAPLLRFALLATDGDMIYASKNLGLEGRGRFVVEDGGKKMDGNAGRDENKQMKNVKRMRSIYKLEWDCRVVYTNWDRIPTEGVQDRGLA